MLPTFHIALTFLLWLLLRKLGLSAGYLFLVMLVPGVLVDFDFLFVKPHRLAPSHSPIFWLIPSLLLAPFFLAYAIGIVVSSLGHLLFDLVDGQIMLLWPLSKKMYGLNLVIRRHGLDPYRNSSVEFSIALLKTPELLALEVGVDILALAIFLTLYGPFGFLTVLLS